MESWPPSASTFPSTSTPTRCGPPSATWATPHQIFGPVLTDCRFDGDDTRVVTFANGMVVHERIVDVDDDARRLAYTVLDGPFTHHHATFVVAAEPDGTSVLSWVSDVLPHDVAPMVEDLMDQGALAAQHALGYGAKLES